MVQKLRRRLKALGTRCITQLGAAGRCATRGAGSRGPVWRVNWTNQVIMVQVNYRTFHQSRSCSYYGRRVWTDRGDGVPMPSSTRGVWGEFTKSPRERDVGRTARRVRMR